MTTPDPIRQALAAALREAYTLLVSAEPTLIRDAKTGPNETSLHYKALLRDRVAEWLEPCRDHFDEGLAALLSSSPSDDLGAAWKAVEEALPEGWAVTSLLLRRRMIGRPTVARGGSPVREQRFWQAVTERPFTRGMGNAAEGPTPAAALLALRDRLAATTPGIADREEPHD